MALAPLRRGGRAAPSRSDCPGLLAHAGPRPRALALGGPRGGPCRGLDAVLRRVAPRPPPAARATHRPRGAWASGRAIAVPHPGGPGATTAEGTGVGARPPGTPRGRAGEAKARGGHAGARRRAGPGREAG